jgi:hypothetical protein
MASSTGFAAHDAPQSTKKGEEMSFERGMDIARFNELDESWIQTGGLWTRCVFIGNKNDPGSPIGIAMKADRGLGDRIAGKRSFNTTTMTVVLSGTVMHDGRWMTVGDFYVAPPNEVNGDLVFGPEGAVIFMIFDDRSGIVPKFMDERDEARFDQTLRADVEAVATGQCETSVAILPLRDEYTKGRAVVFRTLAEVQQYRNETGTDW